MGGSADKDVLSYVCSMRTCDMQGERDLSWRGYMHECKGVYTIILCVRGYWGVEHGITLAKIGEIM